MHCKRKYHHRVLRYIWYHRQKLGPLKSFRYPWKRTPSRGKFSCGFNILKLDPAVSRTYMASESFKSAQGSPIYILAKIWVPRPILGLWALRRKWCIQCTSGVWGLWYVFLYHEIQLCSWYVLETFRPNWHFILGPRAHGGLCSAHL